MPRQRVCCAHWVLGMTVLLDGVRLEEAAARVSLFDRGFQYGDGLFETLAVVAGRPLFWEAHFARLQRSARLLGLPMAAEALWRQEAEAAIDPAVPRQVLKLMLSRGVGSRGYGPSGQETATRVVYTSPWPGYLESHWRRGIVARHCRTPLLGGAAFATLKTLNRLNQVLARQELTGSGADEGLMTDTGGHLREGTFTNLFWVRAGQVETPRLDFAGIPGIMRGEIIAWLRQRGQRVVEVDATAAVLDEASECFVSNSLIGIWPVRAVGDKAWPDAPGPVSRHLLAWLETLSLA